MSIEKKEKKKKIEKKSLPSIPQNKCVQFCNEDVSKYQLVAQPNRTAMKMFTFQVQYVNEIHECFASFLFVVLYFE